MTRMQQRRRTAGGLAGLTLSGAFTLMAEPAAAQGFRIEEAGIADIDAAIVAKRTTCTAIVEAYIERARAYNGACTVLVTKDGASVAPATGSVRAGTSVKFPMQTLPLSTYFPDLDKYEGKPFELGRTEPTRSEADIGVEHRPSAGRCICARDHRGVLRCLDSSHYEPRVREGMEAGRQLGIEATPTVFVNGRIVNGAQPVDVFAKVIDGELDRAGARR